MRTIIIVLALILGSLAINSTFIVNEGQTALVLQFGRIDHAGFAPGIHFKLPFIQQVLHFDQRVLNLEAPPERYFTSEKKSANVDFYAKWRIEDVSAYYRSFGADEERSQAIQRLAPIIKDALRFEFNARTMHDLIAGGRADITEHVRDQANKAALATFGIRVVDVRIKRIELPDEVSERIYNRMRAERQKVANELRAEGAEASMTIHADADRQEQVLRAEAYRDAQKVRGEGDAKAAEIYAAAYGKDAEFYAFYRSLEAYREAFRSSNGVLVMDPKSEFLHYLQDSKLAK